MLNILSLISNWILRILAHCARLLNATGLRLLIPLLLHCRVLRVIVLRMVIRSCGFPLQNTPSTYRRKHRHTSQDICSCARIPAVPFEHRIQGCTPGSAAVGTYTTEHLRMPGARSVSKTLKSSNTRNSVPQRHDFHGHSDFDRKFTQDRCSLTLTQQRSDVDRSLPVFVRLGLSLRTVKHATLTPQRRFDAA